MFITKIHGNLLITGNVETALSMTNELLELQPGHERATGNKIYYEGEIRNLPPQLEENLRGDDGSVGLATQATVSGINNDVA